MADSRFDSAENYQDTNTYHEASPERRRQLNRYKKECGISDEHMYLLLLKQDLDNVPEQTRDRSDTSSRAMLVIGVLLLWNSLSLAQGGFSGGANVPLIFLSLGILLYMYAREVGVDRSGDELFPYLATGINPTTGQPFLPLIVDCSTRCYIASAYTHTQEIRITRDSIK